MMCVHVYHWKNTVVHFQCYHDSTKMKQVCICFVEKDVWLLSATVIVILQLMGP